MEEVAVSWSVPSVVCYCIKSLSGYVQPTLPDIMFHNESIAQGGQETETTPEI